MKVFVYGTLQQGERNHRLLKDAMFLGEAVTLTHYAMVDCGFPFILREPALAPVVGELFDIGDDAVTVQRLDRLESEGVMYDRVIGLVTCGGEHHIASYYVACAGRAVYGDEVPVNAAGLLVWPRERVAS
jgi:gamma-glutamylcyclotransferase (GGCT)/AIG2-like uncharacterized protein YtfP